MYMLRKLCGYEIEASAQPAELNNVERVLLRFIVCASLLTFLTLVIAAATGLRGSDQYWYTAEVEQLMTGGPATSTVVFPYHAANNFVPPPFNHHSAAHYFVLPLAMIFGAYHGWIILNAIGALLSAALLGLIAARMGGRSAGVFVFSTSLLLPLSFWTALQPYQETLLSTLLVASLYVYIVVSDSRLKWILLAVICGVMFLCRLSALPLLALVPMAYLLHARPGSRGRLLTGAVLVGVAGCTILLGPKLLESDPALTLPRYMNSRVPEISDNMHLLHTLEEEPIELWKVWKKMKHGVILQFVKGPLPIQLFYLPFNLMLLLGAFLCFQLRGEREKRVVIAFWTLAAVHFMVAAFRGNEFRFLMFISPILLLTVVIGLSKLPWFQDSRRWLYASMISLLVYICIDLPLAKRLVEESALDASLRSRLTQKFDIVPERDSVIVAINDRFVREELVLGYVLRPRLSLLIKPKYNYSPEELNVMQRNVVGRWLFAPEDSPFVDHFAGGAAGIQSGFPAPFEDYQLFQIPRR